MQPIYAHSAKLILPAHLAPQDIDIVRYFRLKRKHMLIAEFGMMHCIFELTCTDIFTLHFRFHDSAELYYEKNSEIMKYLYAKSKKKR